MPVRFIDPVQNGAFCNPPQLVYPTQPKPFVNKYVHLKSLDPAQRKGGRGQLGAVMWTDRQYTEGRRGGSVVLTGPHYPIKDDLAELVEVHETRPQKKKKKKASSKQRWGGLRSLVIHNVPRQ